jgi:hypothetical protein
MPLLENNPDLAWVGRQIYLKPVHHFARMILIGRILDKDGFRPQWAVVHLFEWRRSFPLSWGEWLSKTSGSMPGSWRIDDSDASSALVETIERNALPLLRSMTTLDDYLTFVSRNYFRHQLYDWPDAKVIVDAALGNLDGARALCDANIRNWSTDKPNYDDDDREKFARLRKLCALVREDDRSGIARLLHAWEAETVKNLKIEHIWEPTPFPLELQSAQ